MRDYQLRPLPGLAGKPRQSSKNLDEGRYARASRAAIMSGVAAQAIVGSCAPGLVLSGLNARRTLKGGLEMTRRLIGGAVRAGVFAAVEVVQILVEV